MKNNAKQILDAFHFRHACKKYDPQRAVSQEDFDTILEAARLSPSSFGFEPWHLIVLRDETIKQKLYPIAWGARNSIDGASHLVLLLARKKADTLADAPYITHLMRDIHHLPGEMLEKRRAVYHNFLKNDFRLLGDDRALFDWASKQTYIMLANMMTTAALLGVDSCPIEGFDQNAVDELLADEGLMDPAHFGISVMVSFGYRANQPAHEKTRQPLADLVQWV